MNFLFKMLLLALAGLLAWSCNLSDGERPSTLTFHLNDSLKTASGKYDSIHLDLYVISAGDTVFNKTLFHGVYSDPAQLEDMPLGNKTGGNFIIHVLAYRNKQVVLEAGVPFSGGTVSAAPIVYKAPDSITLLPHGVVFVSGLRNVSMAEGEKKRIVLKGASEASVGIRFEIQNLDSLRGLFPDGNKAISIASAGDSLVIIFSPGSAKGNYRFRIALSDTLKRKNVQVLVVSVGSVNRPPVLSLMEPDPGQDFSLKEGKPITIRIVYSDPDAGNTATLISLRNPPWPQCGSGQFDTSKGLLSFTPSFQCIASGESTLADLDFRATDNGSPAEVGQLSLHFTIVDSNSAPKWKSATINLSGKEGEPLSKSLADVYSGDAEKDSIEFTVTCGSFDKSALVWSFIPGFRDAGNKNCDIIVLDSHIPPASSKLILNLDIADSARKVDVAIVSPVTGFATRDSQVIVKWNVGNQAQAKDTMENLKAEGLNVIRRTFMDSMGNIGMDSVSVYLDTRPPFTPIVSSYSSSHTNSSQPVWNWKSGGNGGSGVFRYKLGDEMFSTGALQSRDLTYKPSSPLGEGLHKLYVQEQDSVGNWSSSGIYAIVVDITSPSLPVVNISSGTPTNNRVPIFSWSTGGKGDLGLFRYKLDDSSLTTGARLSKDTVYKPDAPGLSEGLHVFYVQEQDSAGNWSQIARKTIMVDLTPPSAPVVFSPSLHTNNSRPTWHWKSGGNGGIGVFRYELDDMAVQVGGLLTSEASLTPAFDLTIGSRHTLYVQERDSAGNWSELGSYRIHIHGQIGYAVGANGAILKTLNSGIAWDTVFGGEAHGRNAGALNSVYFSDSNNGVAVGSSGMILKTTNGGASWSHVNSGTLFELYSVHFANSRIGYVSSDNGEIIKTVDGGDSWGSPHKITSQFLSSVFFTNAENGVAVGGAGAIFRTNNGGASWDSISSPTKSKLASVYFADSKTGYIGGQAGTILKTNDGGLSWTLLSSGTSEWVHSINFVNNDTGYAGSEAGLFLKTIDGGTHWISMHTGRTESMNSIYFTDLKTGYAVGSENLILKTVNGGESWVVAAAPRIVFSWMVSTPGLPDMITELYPSLISICFP